jgi:hypothetical protein
MGRVIVPCPIYEQLKMEMIMFARKSTFGALIILCGRYQNNLLNQDTQYLVAVRKLE